MKTPKFHIRIQPSEVVKWTAGKGAGRGAGPWFSDAVPEDVAVVELAKQISRDLSKWQIAEVKHASKLPWQKRKVSEEKRNQIILAALNKIITNNAQ